MHLRKLGFAVAALGISAFAPTAGIASTCNTAVNTHSTACVVESGNNENQNLNTIVAGGLFGISTWVEVSHALDLDTPANNVGPLINPGTTGAGTQSGTWAVANFTNVLDAMLIVKAGNQFAAYFLNTAFTSGIWGTLGLLVGSGQTPNVSHIALYEVACGGTTGISCPSNQGTTPLPGAVWLFGTVLAGGAGFGQWRKRRKAAAIAAA
jgi:hypothetical protein